MPAKRPEPLSEEYWEPVVRPSAAGATLLGRTQNVRPTSGSKKPLVDPAAAPALLAPPTPGALARLTPLSGVSPLGSSRGRAQPQQWTFTHPFTPIATPSPTGNYSLFHRGLGPVTTPVSRHALGLAKATLTPRGDALGQPLDPRAAQAARSAAVDAHASLFSRPVTYAITPTSARASGLPAPQAMRNRRGVVSLQQALMPDAPEQKPQGEDEDPDDDDESGDEASQPQAQRRPEDVPKPPPGALHPSLGSEGHAIGACKRCCFFPRGRCMNGYECQFCHYEHEKRKRKNKKKNKRAGVAAHQVGVGRGVRPLVAHNNLGVTMPGNFVQARSSVVMPAGYPSAQVLQVVPQQHQLLYSAPQVMPMASQQDLLAHYQLSSGAYCVVQPQPTLIAAHAMSAYTGVQQPQQQQQQLIVLEPASMPQPQQLQHPQHKQHLEPPPPPPQAPGLCQAQQLPPPPAASPTF